MGKLEPVKNTPKKKYAPPKLTKYGTVRELTKKVGAHGNPDGGGFPRNKTAV
ncbi:MAG TPA: lasso RiPP family leader peptide-containing protein [Candidatus Dormibacteraeota bacterium]|nr:lasso RiPP family leader peptide-containing protein [Candidatus Dormibacteraeota bacterium]